MVTVNDFPDGFAATWIRDRAGKTIHMSRKLHKPKNWFHAVWNRLVFQYSFHCARILSMKLFYADIDHSFDQVFFTNDGKPVYYIYRSYFAGGQCYKGIAPWLRWGGDV